MPLQRGEVQGYDFDQMTVEFTILNQGKVIMCAISTAAMDNIEGTRDVRPDQRIDQFMRLRDVIEERASRKFFEEQVQADRETCFAGGVGDGSSDGAAVENRSGVACSVRSRSMGGDHGATGFCKQLVAIDSQRTMPPARQAHVERGLLNVRVVVATRDFAWDKEKLDRFIAKPDEVVLSAVSTRETDSTPLV